MPDIVPIYPPRSIAVTPHDTNFLLDHAGAAQPMALFVGVAGNVAVIPSGNPIGAAVVIYTVPAGGLIPVMCSRVRATSTTASGIIGVW